MRQIRPLFSATSRKATRRTPVVATLALSAALALTATACGPGEDDAKSDPSASADQSVKIPESIKEKLKDHGIDVDAWEKGGWKNWDRSKWLREARDFVNPIIDGLWDPDRMHDAKPPQQDVDDNDVSGDQGVTDPEPAPVKGAAMPTPYHQNAPAAGKLLFDSPEGSMVCSATVVKDPAHPGKSNMIWTAGHCVHAGAKGGWYRNLAFVPSYNDKAMSNDELSGASREQVAPYGVWWGDWAQTSNQWIKDGGPTGGKGAPYDFAVLHVTPEKGNSGKSLEETVGSAVDVDFNAPQVKKIPSLQAKGYPAAPPYDGSKLFSCSDAPGRLSIAEGTPTMYRIGCDMTGGSSGGGWYEKGADGKEKLVSNTSIGPVSGGWLAGPHLGDEAKGVYDEVSKKFK